MIVLQAGISNDRFLVWGEQPLEPRAVTVKARGRKPKTSDSPVLPFAVDAGQLARAVGGSHASLAILVWLPTAQQQPIASSPLIAEPPATDAEVTLSPWAVPTIYLNTAQAVDLLCACTDRETLAPGVVVGKTLAYWTTALRLAGALVAREQFLPDLVELEDGIYARWKPILAGNDAQRFRQLAQAMPPACRALCSESSDQPPATPAATLLSAFLDKMVDALVRSSAAPVALVAAPVRKMAKASFDSVHDQWLHVLRSDEDKLTGATAELHKLAEQVREWQRPVAVSAVTPFRLCFRLEEPKINGDETVSMESARGPWRLRYLLQAADDPSLLVPVEEAWTAKGRKAAVLQRNGFHPREYLLAALGQAARVCPPVEDSLKTATPSHYELDATGAHTFLTEQAWLLEQAGFGVMLPAWWTRKGTKLRLSVRANVTSPKMKNTSGVSLGDPLAFDWQVAIGDQLLSLQELETLAKLKAPLVRVRGQWVQLNADEIQAALDFWKNKETGKATLREVVQMALGATEAPSGLPIDGVSADGWVNDFLAQLEGRTEFEELLSPARFHGTLRPYQVRGYSWLGFLRRSGLGACLADDMGLGKTVQTLALIQRDWESNGRRPVLLICPMSVVGNWHKEAERFTPDLPVLVHHGGQRQKGPAFKKETEKHALVLSSYALLHRDLDIFKEVSWAGVILDEAQNIKNPETKQAKAARSLPGDYRIALTGTPVENHVGDLWSIMEFLNPGFLGTHADFKRRFFIPIQAGHDPEAAKRLKRLTGPFLLRRLKTDKSIIADLPDKLEMKVFCTLTKEQASLYAAVVEEATNTLEKAQEGIQRKGVILATLSKLKQVCNHPAQFLGDNSAIPDRSGKLARLTEMLEEVAETGDRALIFTQFGEMGAISSATCRKPSAARCSSCTAASPRSSATAWWSASRRVGHVSPLIPRPSSSYRSRPAAPGST